jgi:hypothetical protein
VRTSAGRSPGLGIKPTLRTFPYDHSGCSTSGFCSRSQLRGQRWLRTTLPVHPQRTLGISNSRQPSSLLGAAVLVVTPTASSVQAAARKEYKKPLLDRRNGAPPVGQRLLISASCVHPFRRRAKHNRFRAGLLTKLRGLLSLLCAVAKKIRASQWRDRAGLAPASLFSRCQ